VNRPTLVHVFCLIAVVSSFLTGFYAGMARSAKAVVAVHEANNALILTRIKRQALIWRSVVQSPGESPLEPEIGRGELESRRATLLQIKP